MTRSPDVTSLDLPHDETEVFEVLARVTPLYKEYLSLAAVSVLADPRAADVASSNYNPLGLVVWPS